MDSSVLKVGGVYLITHLRKGKFVALLENIERAEVEDDRDKYLLVVRYDVRPGTDQHGLSTQQGQSVRESRLRPSLITDIQEYKGGEWLREVKPTPASRPDKELLNALAELTQAIKEKQDG